MGNTTHLAWRAALAIALMVCFYGLALAVVAVLIAIPLVLLRLSIGLFIKVGLFCVVGAYVILKSILPRRDHFEPPGPRLAPEHQPRLFAEIRDVAAAVRQAEPAEVYLVPDVNAWVDNRGSELDWSQIGRKLVGGQANANPLEAADSMVGIALALALSRAGFTVESLRCRG